MSQTHHIEAIITAQDNGASQALQRVQQLIDGVLANVGRLNSLNIFFKALDDSTTPLGKAFDNLRLKFMIFADNAGLTGGKLAVLKAVFAKILVPIAAVIAIVIGLIDWWQALGERNSELQERLLAVWETIRSAWESAVERIGDSINGLIGAFSHLWDSIKPVIDLLIEIIVGTLAPLIGDAIHTVGAVGGSVIDILTGLVDFITGVINIIIGLFTLDLNLIIDGTFRIFTGIFNAVYGILEAVITFIAGFVLAIVNAFLGLGLSVATTLDNFIDGIISWVIGVKDTGVQGITDFVQAVVGIFRGIGDQVMDALRSLGARIADFFNNLPGINILRNLFGGRSASATMAEVGNSLIQGLAFGMEQANKQVEAVVSNTINTIEKGMKDIMSMGQNLGTMLTGSDLAYNANLILSSPDHEQQRGLMEEIRDAIKAGQNIIMDSGELVGATYHNYDCTAGSTISYNKRWGR